MVCLQVEGKRAHVLSSLSMFRPVAVGKNRASIDPCAFLTTMTHSSSSSLCKQSIADPAVLRTNTYDDDPLLAISGRTEN